jgi:hypothetical protein
MSASSYKAAKAAKVGETVACGCCNKKFVKRSYQQAFCSNRGNNNCKDRYWNEAVPERKERALSRRGSDDDEHPFSDEAFRLF